MTLFIIVVVILYGCLQIAHPNVAEAYRFTFITMSLQLYGSRTMFYIAWFANKNGLPCQNHIILYQHPVFKSSYLGRCFYRAIFIKSWGSPNGIIALPFGWGLAGVYHRYKLFVYAAGLTVNIGF